MSEVAEFFILNTKPGWTLFDAYLVGVIVGAVLVFWLAQGVDVSRERNTSDKNS